MRGFIEVFRLEMVSLVRSKTLAMLTVASIVWMFVMPLLVRGDGTPEGARELFIRYSLGGVFALLVVALLASATGSLARERAARRLQLTMVRPVRYLLIVLAKIAALTACGAVVLALSSVVMALRTDLSMPCFHVLKPVMPSPSEEAKTMYQEYMNDPETPAAVRKAKKSVVLRLLANRAMDRYQTISTNESAVWEFNLAEVGKDAFDADCGAAVRIRFTNQFDMRQDVRGLFRIGEAEGVASNITQAVVKIPLRRSGAASGDGSAEASGKSSLSFRNLGKSALMLRPRRDVDLLLPADSFLRNLLRAYVEMVAVLALVVSFGLLLSASLGRPVALFVAIVSLVVGEMSPSVIEQYPDELETKTVDRIGLVLTRFAAEVTRPVSALNPIERLASDACVEPREVVRVALTNLVAAPLALALIAAFLLPRKQDEL